MANLLVIPFQSESSREHSLAGVQRNFQGCCDKKDLCMDNSIILHLSYKTSCLKMLIKVWSINFGFKCSSLSSQTKIFYCSLMKDSLLVAMGAELASRYPWSAPLGPSPSSKMVRPWTSWTWTIRLQGLLKFSWQAVQSRTVSSRVFGTWPGREDGLDSCYSFVWQAKFKELFSNPWQA